MSINKLIIFTVIACSMGRLFASSIDTVKTKIKTPKHYFLNTLYIERYSNKKIALNDTGNVRYGYLNKRLKSYQYKQTAGGFFFPIYTKDTQKSDSVISNFHLLGTGSYLLSQPIFGGIENHTLFKGSLGLRLIYNSGKKNIYYYDLTPFFATDLSKSDRINTRFASTFVFDRIVSEKFSWRVGFTRTFTFGNRVHLPYIGFRVGKLDKTYFSFQFPKRLLLSFPIGSKFRGNLYTKPIGGIYNMANSDSIYFRNEKGIIFGRFELLSGFKLDYQPNQYFGLFVSLGKTTKNYLLMAGHKKNQIDKFGTLFRFYEQYLPNSGFINFGLTVRFGHAKKIYNNRNMYEVMDLNNSEGTGDNNTDVLNNNIPPAKQKKQKIVYDDIKDLIDAQDMY